MKSVAMNLRIGSTRIGTAERRSQQSGFATSTSGSGMPKKYEEMRRAYHLILHHTGEGVLLQELMDKQDFIDVMPVIDDLRSHLPNARYLCAALEKGKGKPDEPGKLHIHVYVEFFTSIRWSTLVRRTQPWFCKVKPVKNRRGYLRDYVRKSEGSIHDDGTQVAGPWEWGEYREDTASEKGDCIDDAIAALADGATPYQIYLSYPRIYFYHRNKIHALYNDLRGLFTKCQQQSTYQA